MKDLIKATSSTESSPRSNDVRAITAYQPTDEWEKTDLTETITSQKPEMMETPASSTPSGKLGGLVSTISGSFDRYFFMDSWERSRRSITKRYSEVTKELYQDFKDQLKSMKQRKPSSTSL
eukprot:NODE_7352_length_787_cov_17.882530_g6742_i0.p1 GENE.NODE_7352_length_787_cov_17.882530_g6742_i0~~NODE_7352_length_787_cov_17.882530_g6742_i0.p1  ORF type:complete len:121 (-),score=31.81 NODE_7352_length_787_cov_17.882530_g6742_i0:371-733(-)